jgi:hypothetical protein
MRRTIHQRSRNLLQNSDSSKPPQLKLRNKLLPRLQQHTPRFITSNNTNTHKGQL